ncbi:MAG: hypothetical protein HON94_13810 [Methylococcales bacterium]|jgi:hypothetical protein|nr:hypothetical protein [Methylococcales bacterium]MBT7408464.1 hypothetical protein [Methylococcales bacterium]
MLNESIKQCKKMLDKQGFMLYFRGPMTQNDVVELGKTIQRNVLNNEKNTSVKTKVFSIFVELVQNMIRYSDDQKLKEISKYENHENYIIVRNQNSVYSVICGNVVDKKKHAYLEEKLNILLQMDQQELKVYYKEQRRKAPPEDSLGAGIGLIEMARKSSEPIEYEMTSIDDQYSFFSMSVTI